MQGHLEKRQVGQEAEGAGKGMVRAHIVIPREEMGEAVGKFKQV